METITPNSGPFAQNETVNGSPISQYIGRDSPTIPAETIDITFAETTPHNVGVLLSTVSSTSPPSAYEPQKFKSSSKSLFLSRFAPPSRSFFVEMSPFSPVNRYRPFTDPIDPLLLILPWT